MKTKLGLHTFKALQAAAAELQARKPQATPAQTRRINDAHRSNGVMPPVTKKEDK